MNSDHLVQSNMMGSLPLLFFLLLLLISGVRFGGSVRLGNGGYEEWRLGTATYIKESQGHPLNDGMRLCDLIKSFFLVNRRIKNVGNVRPFSLFFVPFPLSFCIFSGWSLEMANVVCKDEWEYMVLY